MQIFGPLGPKTAIAIDFKVKKVVLRYKALKIWYPMYWDTKCKIELRGISAVVEIFSIGKKHCNLWYKYYKKK